MSKVKILYWGNDISIDEPDDYASLLEDIKENFEDEEEIVKANNEELIIKDGNQNIINNNEDYDKYIKQSASNKIIIISLKNDEQKSFSLLDFKYILDEKYNEEEELQKIQKEKEIYEKKQRKIPKVNEEEKIKYDSIFDEFTYIAKTTNKNILSLFWKFFKDKCLIKFLENSHKKTYKKFSEDFQSLKNEIENNNNETNKLFSEEIKSLKNQIENNNKEMKKYMNDLNKKIDEEKKEIKTYIEEKKNEIIKSINENVNSNMKDIKNTIDAQNNTIINKIEKKLEEQEKNINNISKILSENNQFFEEQINKQSASLKENQVKINEDITNHFKDNNKILLKIIPQKAKIDLFQKDLNIKDILGNKAKLKVNIKNLSKINLEKCRLECIKDKNSIIEFKTEKNINIAQNSEKLLELNLQYTQIKETEEPFTIHMILYNQYDEEINDFFANYNIKNN